MKETTTAGDDAPPHGIPRPQWAVRFFDEDGTKYAGFRFPDLGAAQECATFYLGTETRRGTVLCLARFFASDGDGWVATGGEMEY